MKELWTQLEAGVKTCPNELAALANVDCLNRSLVDHEVRASVAPAAASDSSALLILTVVSAAMILL